MLRCEVYYVHIVYIVNASEPENYGTFSLHFFSPSVSTSLQVPDSEIIRHLFFPHLDPYLSGGQK